MPLEDVLRSLGQGLNYHPGPNPTAESVAATEHRQALREQARSGPLGALRERYRGLGPALEGLATPFGMVPEALRDPLWMAPETFRTARSAPPTASPDQRAAQEALQQQMLEQTRRELEATSTPVRQSPQRQSPRRMVEGVVPQEVDWGTEADIQRAYEEMQREYNMPGTSGDERVRIIQQIIGAADPEMPVAPTSPSYEADWRAQERAVQRRMEERMLREMASDPWSVRSQGGGAEEAPEPETRSYDPMQDEAQRRLEYLMLQKMEQREQKDLERRLQDLRYR